MNKDFLLYLCKDEAYGEVKDIISGTSSNEPEEQCENHFGCKDSQIIFEQIMRFSKRDCEHRSFIRAFLYDYIFKTFVQILDECISQRDKLIEERQYFADKKCNHLENEAVAIQHQLKVMEQKHKGICENYENRIAALKGEQKVFQDNIAEYKEEIYRLKDFNARYDTVAALQKSVRETGELMREADLEL